MRLRHLLLPALLAASAGLRATEYEIGPAREYKTLQEVATLLKPGDTAYIDGGATYPGGVTLAHGGDAGKPVSVIGRRVNGARPVITGAPGGSILRVTADHCIIAGLEIRGDPAALRCFYNVGDDVTLRDCAVHDSPCTGIAGADASGSLTLDHVEVYRCGTGLYAHQIYVGSSIARYPEALFRMEHCHVHDGTGGNDVKSRVTRNEIRYNWIEGSAFHLLDLDGPDPKSQPGMNSSAHCDANVVGNVLTISRGSGGTLARLGSDGTGESRGRYAFAYNTVVVQGARGARFGLFWIKGRIERLDVWDNVFWSQGAIPMNLLRVEGVAGGMGGMGNWTSEGASRSPWRSALGSNPGFISPDRGDYRPAPGSPLIGAARLPSSPDLMPLAMPSGRAPGGLRAGAADIGAYQAATQ